MPKDGERIEALRVRGAVLNCCFQRKLNFALTNMLTLKKPSNELRVLPFFGNVQPWQSGLIFASRDPNRSAALRSSIASQQRCCPSPYDVATRCLLCARARHVTSSGDQVTYQIIDQLFDPHSSLAPLPVQVGPRLFGTQCCRRYYLVIGSPLSDVGSHKNSARLAPVAGRHVLSDMFDLRLSSRICILEVQSVPLWI